MRKRRLELGWSQEKLAENLGYHRNYVGTLERGERNASLKSVEVLAGVLGVDPADLLR